MYVLATSDSDLANPFRPLISNTMGIVACDILMVHSEFRVSRANVKVSSGGRRQTSAIFQLSFKTTYIRNMV